MDDLTKLAIKYGTDKWGKHHYTPVYYDLFKDRRNLVKKVIEIGAGEGAGLRMWRDFFPNAMIYGVDNQENRLFNEDRIGSHKCDQSKYNDLQFLLKVLGNDADLIIDDGSHKSSDQVLSALTITKVYKGYFTYVIEDVSEPGISELLAETLSIKVIECGKRYDDRLIICQK